jgi:hypothetical protein
MIQGLVQQVGGAELKHSRSLGKKGSVSMDIQVELPEVTSLTKCINVLMC